MIKQECFGIPDMIPEGPILAKQTYFGETRNSTYKVLKKLLNDQLICPWRH